MHFRSLVVSTLSAQLIFLSACSGELGAGIGDDKQSDPTSGGVSNTSSGGDSASLDESGAVGSGGANASGGAGSGGANAAGGAGSGGSGSGTGGDTGTGGTAPVLGSVDLVPYYESGSAWESNSQARAMVDSVFADVEATRRTSGDWDASIEVYLTDDNGGTANTYFDTSYLKRTVGAQSVLVVSPWAEIVLGETDANGAADTLGNGFDFAISFNVQGHADNSGLLRHEIMHGLGAVNAVSNLNMSKSNTLTGISVGQWVSATVYDLAIRDKNGNALLGNYNSGTEKFQVQSFSIDSTYDSWTDGDAGFSWRGIADKGGNFDMSLGIFAGQNGARLSLNEPSDLMSASAHPTWNTIDEPDRAFFRAMGYEVQ